MYNDFLFLFLVTLRWEEQRNKEVLHYMFPGRFFFNRTRISYMQYSEYSIIMRVSQWSPKLILWTV